MEEIEPGRRRPEEVEVECMEMYTTEGRLVVQFTDVFFTLPQLADLLNSSKQPRLLPSPLKIFELKEFPYFDLQNGARAVENDALLAWWSFFRTETLQKVIADPISFGQIIGDLLAAVGSGTDMAKISGSSIKTKTAFVATGEPHYSHSNFDSSSAIAS